MSARPLSEVYERYAAGLARRDGLDRSSSSSLGRVRLLRELKRHGIKGWPERGTFFTRELPPGCQACLEGKGSNVCVTTRCSRDCFFCFNPKPRGDLLSVHGRSVGSESEAADLLKELGIESVGLSGGEPLLVPEHTVSLLDAIRARLGPGARIDLYTNGDFLTPALARRLKAAGLDGVRVNLAANGYNAKPVVVALEGGLEVDVELPVIPADERRLQGLILMLDKLGAPHLILHELFVCAQNADELKRRGYQTAPQKGKTGLMWSPTAGSREAALRLLKFALEKASRLSVYFCSCATQDWIAETALRRSGSYAQNGSDSR